MLNKCNIDYFEQLPKKLSTEIINKTRNKEGITFLQLFLMTNNVEEKFMQDLQLIIQNANCCGVLKELLLTNMTANGTNSPTMPAGIRLGHLAMAHTELKTGLIDFFESIQSSGALEIMLFIEIEQDGCVSTLGSSMLTEIIDSNLGEYFLEHTQKHGYLEKLFTRSNYKGTTALVQACIDGDLDKVKLLLKYEAPITEEALEKATTEEIKKKLTQALFQERDKLKKLINENKK